VHPIKITIPGTYWDSQIYKGSLYLFDRSGSIRTINWDALIDSLRLPAELKVAAKISLCRGSYLYGTALELLLSDLEILKSLEQKFKALAKLDIHLSEKMLAKFTIGEQQNLFAFPHNDSQIYYDSLYVGTKDGITRAGCGKGTVKPISQRIKLVTDCPTLSFSPKYQALAIAAGDEGLYELSLAGENAQPLTKLSKENTFATEWVYHSVLGSCESELLIAEFDNELETEFSREQAFRVRKYKHLLHGTQIFKRKGFSWGNQDKLCQLSKKSLKIKRYNPFTRDNVTAISDLGEQHVEFEERDVVSAAVSAFGVILELQDSVAIVLSNGKQFACPDEPINWRTFPRSTDYLNQLHVVYENHLQILSFNHDYFQNQTAKIFGTFCSNKQRS